MSYRDGKLARRGATLTEVAMAMLVVMVAMAGLTQLLSLAAQQRRAGEARRLALVELANQAEHVAAMPWEETAASQFTGWEPSAELASAAAAVECRAQIMDEAGPPASRRIELAISWNTAGGRAVDPLKLTLWRFAPGGQP